MRVLVCDDDVAILQSVGDFLELHDVEVDYCARGREAVDLVERNPFDVIVLDVMMPGLSGIDACRELRARGVFTPVLFLTARDSLDDVLAGFDSGGDDYLVKPFAYPELLARITALSMRLSRQGSTSVTIADLVLDLQRAEATRNGELLSLNKTQFKLLKRLALRSPGVVTRAELETEIWGEDLPGTDALRSHIFQLRSIVDKPFGATLIRTVHGVGYCLRPQDEADNGASH